ncbi:MAG: hypothetical protein ACXVCY_10600 [Pseudobdellovibrionaceae bacterium]
MDQRAKWLRDERYIRIAGALLMISPFLNYFTSIALSSNLPDKWALKQLMAGFIVASGLSWVGRISNFIVGVLMFRGKSSAWVPVLAILGFTIAKNILTFKSDYQINHIQTVSSLIVNIFLFLLVFESEYRINKEINRRIKEAQLQRSKNAAAKSIEVSTKTPVLQKIETSKTKVTGTSPLHFGSTPLQPLKRKSDKLVERDIKPPTAQDKVKKLVKEKTAFVTNQQKLKKNYSKRPFVIRKGTLIDFDSHGKFAKVFYCTENELWLKVIDHLPSDIHKRIVTLQDPGKKGIIRLKFSRLKDDTLIFRVIA